MFDKILAKLKGERGKTSQVSDRTLEDTARALESIIVSDEILAKYDAKKAISTLEGNINAVVSTEKTNWEKQKEEERKAQSPATPPTVPNMPTTPEDPTQAKIKELTETVSSLIGVVGSLTKQTAQEKRTAALKEVLKDTPAYYQDPILAQIDKMTFAKEEDFNEYVGTVKTSAESFILKAKESGLNTTTPPKGGEDATPKTEISPLMAQALKVVTEDNKPK